MRSYLTKFKEVWLYYDYQPLLLFLSIFWFFLGIQHAVFNNFWIESDLQTTLLLNLELFINVFLPIFMFNKRVVKALLLVKILFLTWQNVNIFFISGRVWNLALLLNALAWFFNLVTWAWIYFRIRREELYNSLKDGRA